MRWSLLLLCVFVAVMSGWCSPVLVQAQESPGLSDDAIDSAGDTVMNKNEFRSLRRRLLETTESDVESGEQGFLSRSLTWIGEKIRNGFQAIGDFFDSLFSGGGGGGGAGPNTVQPASGGSSGGLSLSLAQLPAILAIVAILIILVLIVTMIMKRVDMKKRKSGLLADSEDMFSDVETPPGELAASTYESRAMQLAAIGDYRAAIRELLLGGMSWVERAGMIRYRKGLTNRDYVRAVWRRTEKRDAYIITATQFELVYFGRREPTAIMFEMCLDSFRGAFREEETPTAAV
jgi:hypothetical protein